MPFQCRVASVHDGDTLRCADGTRIRLQGIDANELDGSCHHACATLPADMARDHLRDLVMGRSVACRSTGTSYRRIVASCSVIGPDGRRIDLSCEQIATAGAVIWRRYDPHHHLDHCRAMQASPMMIP